MDWRAKLPVCASCGQIVCEGKSAEEIRGIGYMHGTCAWSISRVFASMSSPYLRSDPRDAIAVLEHSRNEIALAMAAEWMEKWSNGEWK